MKARPKKIIAVLAGLYLLVSCFGKPERPQTMSEASPELTASVDEALSLIGAADEAEQSFYDKSMAVLPFTDLSENTDQEYFSDGLSRDLINRLAIMSDLQVAGRESSFYYKDRDEVLSNIGDALQVENILLGSVRKSGDNLRVTAQLVNADDGFNIWSRTYDRKLADVFAIQNDIVDEVVSALSVTLGAGEFAIPGMTRNIEAYDKTLQALALYDQHTPDNIFRAINLVEEAVQLDPDYGQGWLFLGDIYTGSQLILSQDQAVDFPSQAAKAFAKAAEIAPDMPELMLVEASRLRNQGRFLESDNMYQRYFQSYGYSVARAMEEYAQMLARTGQFNEALAMLNRARRTEPFAPRYTYQVALLSLYRGQDDLVSQMADYGMGLDGGEYLFSALEWELALRNGELAKAAELIKLYFKESSELYLNTPVSRHFMEKFAAVLSLNDFEGSTEDIIAMINDPSVTPLELGYMARLLALMEQPQIALDYWFGQMASPAIWDDIYADMRRLPDFNQLLQEKGLVDYWRATGNWGEFCVAAAGQDFVCK
jgi:TolB-like protein